MTERESNPDDLELEVLMSACLITFWNGFASLRMLEDLAGGLDISNVVLCSSLVSLLQQGL
ncbi:MAG TPA: hypothetical protein VGO47_02900 [Chlamydiales bacterium]|jgi:hypothetical protein|nr:hypothetical protein [Chlamydiales bacterium]